jgi:hypothetical protein
MLLFAEGTQVALTKIFKFTQKLSFISKTFCTFVKNLVYIKTFILGLLIDEYEKQRTLAEQNSVGREFNLNLPSDFINNLNCCQ